MTCPLPHWSGSGKREKRALHWWPTSVEATEWLSCSVRAAIPHILTLGNSLRCSGHSGYVLRGFLGMAGWLCVLALLFGCCGRAVAAGTAGFGTLGKTIGFTGGHGQLWRPPGVAGSCLIAVVARQRGNRSLEQFCSADLYPLRGSSPWRASTSTPSSGIFSKGALALQPVLMSSCCGGRSGSDECTRQTDRFTRYSSAF